MVRTILCASTLIAVIICATPSVAQSQQDQLGARYDPALAAGYESTVFCSAGTNVEAIGTTRSRKSVHEWELTGIQQAPLDEIVRESPYKTMRQSNDLIARVAVNRADDMLTRTCTSDVALHRTAGRDRKPFYPGLLERGCRSDSARSLAGGGRSVYRGCLH